MIQVIFVVIIMYILYIVARVVSKGEGKLKVVDTRDIFIRMLVPALILIALFVILALGAVGLVLIY